MATDLQPFVPPPPGVVTKEAGAARYLIVRLDEQGQIEIQGSRQAVESFLQACAEEGLLISLDHLSWCG